MTSRQRILATIAHREPDRVPVDLGCPPSSGISAIAYGRLKEHLGIRHGRTLVYDVVQQAVAETGANVSVVFVPARWAADAGALDAVISTESAAMIE